MVMDEAVMARWRKNLYRLTCATLFSGKDGADDALSRALGLLKAGEHY